MASDIEHCFRTLRLKVKREATAFSRAAEPDVQSMRGTD
jgi:hypothetical protein